MGGDSEVELTTREQEVLSLLSEGCANKDIADALGCSVRTVEFHISNLLRKVGVSSRLELVARGRREAPMGALPVGDESPLIELRIFSGVAAALLGDALIVLWSASASQERWAWKRSLLDELVGKHAAGALCLSLIAHTSTPPDGALRARMKADFRNLGPTLRRFVAVPLGNSIWLAIVRTIGRAVLLISGRSERQRVARSVDQGISYLLESAGPATPSRAEIEVAISELSRVLGVVRPALSTQKAG